MTDTSHNYESAWLKAKRKMASVLTASEKLAEKGEAAAARRKAHNDGLRGSQGYMPEKKKIIHWTLTTAEMDTLKRIANIPASYVVMVSKSTDIIHMESVVALLQNLELSMFFVMPSSLIVWKVWEIYLAWKLKND